MTTLTEDEEPERPDGALETGLWCGRCLLPSGIRWPVYGHRPGTRRAVPIGSAVICHDCGAQLAPDGTPIR